MESDLLILCVCCVRLVPVKVGGVNMLILINKHFDTGLNIFDAVISKPEAARGPVHTGLTPTGNPTGIVVGSSATKL